MYARVIFITFPSSQLFLIPKTLAFDQFHHVKIDQFSNHYLSKNSFTIWKYMLRALCWHIICLVILGGRCLPTVEEIDLLCLASNHLHFSDNSLWSDPLQITHPLTNRLNTQFRAILHLKPSRTEHHGPRYGVKYAGRKVLKIFGVDGRTPRNWGCSYIGKQTSYRKTETRVMTAWFILTN